MGTATPSIPASQDQLYINVYFAASAFALLYYDYCLTFSIEVERYWNRKLTWASCLFFLNRYISILGQIPNAVAALGLLDNTPAKRMLSYTQLVSFVFVIVVLLLAGIVMIMRTHVLYRYDRRVLAVLLIVAILTLGAGGWAIATGKDEFVPEIDQYPHCNVPISKPQSQHLAAAWSGVLFFDTLVFSLTIYKSLIFGRLQRRGFVYVVFRDGSIYFAAMFASHLTTILCFLLGTRYTRALPTTLASSVSSVAITRLMLSLRNPTHQGVPTDTAGRVVSTVPGFNHSRLVRKPRALDSFEMSNSDGWTASPSRGTATEP